MKNSSIIGVTGGVFFLREHPHLCYSVTMISRTRTLIHFVGIELLGSVLHFPLWWYTEGLARLTSWLWQQLRFRWKQYSFEIWIKNLFVPMYGQYDWSGRLISVLMRIVVLCGRSIALVVEAMLYVVMLVLWVSMPPISLLLFLLNIYQGAFSFHLPFVGAV